jgi:hypothetical protein
MTDEDRILALMAEQSRLTVEIERLQQEPSRDEQQIAVLRRQHREAARDLIALLDGPLRAELKGVRARLDDAGVQYTEMVHDFFVKLLERSVQTNDSMRTFVDLKHFVATVLLNQMRDYLKVERNHRKIEASIAPMSEQKRRYFEERYRTSFLDFLERIELWEDSDDGNLHLAARVLLLHYVAGENWVTSSRSSSASPTGGAPSSSDLRRMSSTRNFVLRPDAFFRLAATPTACARWRSWPPTRTRRARRWRCG